jgi:hypothetical protein
MAADAWVAEDPTACPICGLENCEEHLVAPPAPVAARAPRRLTSAGLDPTAMADAVAVAAEGRRIAETGVPYLLRLLIPAFGMLGMLVAFTKVGKTTLGQMIAAAIATGRQFLGLDTRQTRVLIIAAEDPPQYTAFLARHLDVPEGVLTFYRGPILLDAAGLAAITTTVKTGGYGLVLIASWQAVIRGLIRDENDNAASVVIVEQVKAAARLTNIPWLIDAHSGKGEDQGDDADPSKAMRGASGAAGSADYTLSLRYANGPFGSRRRLSGKGRFVDFAPMLLDYDKTQGTYSVIASAAKDVMAETTWRLIVDTGALTDVPQTADAIARAAGLVSNTGRVTSTGRRQVAAALFRRDDVRITIEKRRGQQTRVYARLTEKDEEDERC